MRYYTDPQNIVILYLNGHTMSTILLLSSSTY